MRILLLLWLIILSGCSQHAPFSIYSVSEAQLEQLIKQQLPSLTKTAQVTGIPFSLAVQSMQVSIGPDNSEVVRITTVAGASVSLFGLTYPANLSLAIEGAPFYHAAEQAVYIRSVRLLDSTIDAAGYRGNLAPVSQELLQLVNQFLASQPVYKLDTTDPKVKVLTALPLDMKVQNGRLAFVPTASAR